MSLGYRALRTPPSQPSSGNSLSMERRGVGSRLRHSDIAAGANIGIGSTEALAGRRGLHFLKELGLAQRIRRAEE